MRLVESELRLAPLLVYPGGGERRVDGWVPGERRVCGVRREAGGREAATENERGNRTKWSKYAWMGICVNEYAPWAGARSFEGMEQPQAFRTLLRGLMRPFQSTHL